MVRLPARSFSNVARRFRRPWLSLEVLPGVDDALDAPKLFLRLAHERLDVDDPLALLPGDLRPVVGVGGVGEVLVLLELLADGGEQVVGHDALLAAPDVALEGELFGPAHDRFDHGAGGEVLEVEDLFIAVGVGDLEEAVLLAERVHGLDGGGDHGGDGAGDIGAPRLGFGEGDVGGQVLGEDVGGGAAVGALDLDLHVEPAGAEDGRVDEVLAVGGADDDDVLEALDAVDLGQELGDDGGLDVGGDAGAAGAEEGVHFVEENNDGDVLGGLFLGLDEDLADLALGFADVLVEEIGALELVFFVVVGGDVRELDGVLDGLDLVAEAADIVVDDVWHFLEGKVFDFALG